MHIFLLDSTKWSLKINFGFVLNTLGEKQSQAVSLFSPSPCPIDTYPQPGLSGEGNDCPSTSPCGCRISRNKKGLRHWGPPPWMLSAGNSHWTETSKISIVEVIIYPILIS